MVVHDITGEQIPWPAWVCGTQNHRGDFRQSGYDKHLQKWAAALGHRVYSDWPTPGLERIIEQKMSEIPKGSSYITGDYVRGIEKRASHDAAQQATIKNLEKELAEAVGYATRLFKTVAPQCEPLPNISGLLTQLDNYIAGAKKA
jgi:hypothetical protein